MLHDKVNPVREVRVDGVLMERRAANGIRHGASRRSPVTSAGDLGRDVRQVFRGQGSGG